MRTRVWVYTRTAATTVEPTSTTATPRTTVPAVCTTINDVAVFEYQPAPFTIVA